MHACDLRPNVPGPEGSIHCGNPEVSGCEETVGGWLRQGPEHVEKPAPEVERLRKMLRDRRRPASTRADNCWETRSRITKITKAVKSRRPPLARARTCWETRSCIERLENLLRDSRRQLQQRPEHVVEKPAPEVERLRKLLGVKSHRMPAQTRAGTCWETRS